MSQNKKPYTAPQITDITNDPTVWTINGQSFILDMQDADVVERYEAAFDKMGEKEKSLPKDGLASTRLRAYCAMFRDLFDDIFGEGAGTVIVGEKDNQRIVTEAYEKFLEFVMKQGATAAENNARVLNRFAPNRAQRRAAGKH